MKKIKRMLRKCLCLDVDERPDFLQMFRDSLGTNSEKKAKIKYHIRVEQMKIEDIRMLFESNMDDEIRNFNDKFNRIIEEMML